MAFVSLRASWRILWTVAVALVFFTRSSAAPAFGGTDKAMVSTLLRFLVYLWNVDCTAKKPDISAF